MAQAQSSQLPRLSRKEFAATVRATYQNETVDLTDDEVIEVALQVDPATQDVLETPEETLFRESGAPAPPPLGAPSGSEIPPPQDAALTAQEDRFLNLLPQEVREPLRAVGAKVRPFSQGVQEGLTAGMLPAEVKSTDSPTARVVGNLTGGVATAASAAAVGGYPALGLLGAGQGTALATRANLDKLEAQRQAAGAAAHAEGRDFTYQEPSITDTLTPQGISRVAGQAGANALVNMLPPLVRNSKLGSILLNSLAGGAAAPLPTAVDQLVEQGTLNPSDPAYKDAYRLSLGVGLGGGAVAGTFAKGRPRPQEPPLSSEGPFYDIPPKRGDKGPGERGPRYTGTPGSVNEEGWLNVGDEVWVGAKRVRQMRHVKTEDGSPASIELAFDDGSFESHIQPIEFRFPRSGGRVVTINPQKGATQTPPPPAETAAKPPAPAPITPALPPAAAERQAPMGFVYDEAGELKPLVTAQFVGYKDNGLGDMVPLFLGSDGRVRGVASLRQEGIALPEFPTLETFNQHREGSFTPEVQAEKIREYTNVSPPKADFRMGEGDRLREMMKKKGIEPSPEVTQPLNAKTGEEGFANQDLLTHVAATSLGGLVGGLQGDSDDNFNWPMALIGAGIGLGVSTSMRSYFKKIGKEREIIEGLSTHPSINEAYRRTSPGVEKPPIREAIKKAYETFLDDTFTPHALLLREGEDWSARNLGTADPKYFQPAINALDQLTLTKFSIPPAVADNFKTMIADVLKDDNSYERLLRITRLRAEIEQRQNDLARRNEAFGWLREYRNAKRAGDFARAREFRTKIRSTPGVLQPLPDTMRGGVPPDHAMATLKRLEQEAQRLYPDVLQAAENWKSWARGLRESAAQSGVNIHPDVARANRNYFPTYHLDKMGKSGKVSVGGPAGISKSRSGYMKAKDRAKAEDKIWVDLVGPYFTRSLDHEVDMVKLQTARDILTHYDPYKNGTLPPDAPSVKPNGEYTYWEWSIPAESGAGHGRVGGWLPTPVAAEIQKHYVPADAFRRLLDKINNPTKGFLIRASAGGFIFNNVFGNISDMYYATPVTQWPSLTLAGGKAIAATILEGVQGPLQRRGVTLSQGIQDFAQVSEEGRKAGIGTEAAAAEITSQALNDPRIADKAIDPETPARVRAADAVFRPVKGYGRNFDTIRQAGENVTRLAHFIHLVSNNATEPKQAGRIVNFVQGNYNPTNLTPREQDLKRFALFWTFYKNALPNWLPLLGREIAYGDQIVGGRGADRLKTLAPLGKKLAAVSAVGLAANLWNHLFFPDAEASLTDYQREQFHLLMPDFWGKKGMWNEEKGEWNLAYHGFPTPMNVAHRAVGMGGVQNRAIHAARGTGAQTVGEEVERSWEQIKAFWGGLVHPIAGTAAALMTGQDVITGQPVIEPGSTNWQAAMQVAQFPVKGLPGMRQMTQASRDAAEPGESAGHFVRRMLFGSLYQPLNRENQEVRALARAVAGGNRASTAKSQSAREAALFRGEQEQWTPEELNSILTGQDKVSWQGKVVSLSKLPEFIAKMGEVKPEDPGAVEALAKAGKAATADVRRTGPVLLPTRDYLRALGPDAVLKAFLETFQGDQRQGDAWRAGAVSIVQQLRNESKNWEIPASLMMMLQQSPSGEANTEILRRVHGLENAFDPALQRGDQLGRKIFGGGQ